MTRYFCIAILFVLVSGKAVVSAVQLSSYIPVQSSCKSGFLDGEDTLYFTGSIDTTSSSVINRPTVIFDIQRLSASAYETICSLDLSAVTCENNQLSNCYCKSNVSSVLEIILNETANVAYSERELRLSWLNGFLSPDVSTNLMPQIHAKPEEILKVNGQQVNIENCNISPLTQSVISWCISNLNNITLEISSNVVLNTSKTHCVDYTFPVNPSQQNFTISMEELDGCQKSYSYVCSFVEPTTTTLNTTYVPLKNSLSNQTCSDACAGVVAAHVVCTVLIIGITVTAMLITFEIIKGKKYLLFFCIILTFLEIGQIILVIIAGVAIEYTGETAIHIWKIMIIYQCVVYIIFITLQSSLLGIITGCKGFNVWSETFMYAITLICIHTVIGVIVLPIIWIFLSKKRSRNITDDHNLQPKQNLPSENGNNGSGDHHNK